MPKRELNVPIMRVNTEKFKAVPLDKKDEENLLTISTARRSSIEARVLCSRCSSRVERENIYNCTTCGSMVCKNCLAKFDNKQTVPE